MKKKHTNEMEEEDYTDEVLLRFVEGQTFGYFRMTEDQEKILKKWIHLLHPDAIMDGEKAKDSLSYDLVPSEYEHDLYTVIEQLSGLLLEERKRSKRIVMDMKRNLEAKVAEINALFDES